MKSFAEMKAERDRQEAERLAALQAEKAGRPISVERAPVSVERDPVLPAAPAPQRKADPTPAPVAPAQQPVSDPSDDIPWGDEPSHKEPPRRIAGDGPQERQTPQVPAAEAKDARQLEMGGTSAAAKPEPVEAPPARPPQKPPSVARPPASAAHRPPSDPAKDLSMRDGDEDEYWEDEREDEEASRRAEIEKQVMEKLEKEGRLRTGKKPGRRAGRTTDAPIPMSRVRDIPTCLVERAKKLFPSDKAGDSVAAYMYLGEGCPDDLAVPQSVKDLVERFAGKTVTLETMEMKMVQELQRLQNQQRFFTAKLEAVELAVAYAAFKAAGFTSVDPASPDTMDFMVKGVAEVMSRLELQASLKHQRDLAREGRPKRNR